MTASELPLPGERAAGARLAGALGRIRLAWDSLGLGITMDDATVYVRGSASVRDLVGGDEAKEARLVGTVLAFAMLSVEAERERSVARETAPLSVALDDVVKALRERHHDDEYGRHDNRQALEFAADFLLREFGGGGTNG